MQPLSSSSSPVPKKRVKLCPIKYLKQKHKEAAGETADTGEALSVYSLRTSISLLVLLNQQQRSHLRPSVDLSATALVRSGSFSPNPCHQTPASPRRPHLLIVGASAGWFSLFYLQTLPTPPHTPPFSPSFLLQHPRGNTIAVLFCPSRGFAVFNSSSRTHPISGSLPQVSRTNHQVSNLQPV